MAVAFLYQRAQYRTPWGTPPGPIEVPSTAFPSTSVVASIRKARPWRRDARAGCSRSRCSRPADRHRIEPSTSAPGRESVMRCWSRSRDDLPGGRRRRPHRRWPFCQPVHRRGRPARPHGERVSGCVRSATGAQGRSAGWNSRWLTRQLSPESVTERTQAGDRDRHRPQWRGRCRRRRRSRPTRSPRRPLRLRRRVRRVHVSVGRRPRCRSGPTTRPETPLPNLHRWPRRCSRQTKPAGRHPGV